MTFLIAAVPTPAQTRHSDNLRLTALKFSGLRIFSEKQAAAGSGLRVGDPVTIAQLSVAANQLAQSGAFEEVAFQYSTQGSELTAIFTVVESKNLLPCLFDNFVWFSDDQLDKTLRARVPFYAGVAPLSGASQRQIVETLRALLQSNGITGDVQGLPFADHGGAVKAISFRVLGVPMPIKTVNFPGSSAISEKDLEAASSQVMGEDFSITNMTEFASVGLVPLYRQKGYLRAAFDRPQWAVIGNPSPGSSPDIALTLPVKEGAQYFWDKVAWSGNTQLTNDQLEQALSMKHGDIANQQKIDDGFKAIRKSYDKLGYIEASVQPKVNLDDSKLMAAYEVTISEGAQFHMGQLRLSGIPDKAASDLMAKWQLKAGSVYDGTYAMEYINKIAMRRLFEMGIRVKGVNLKSQPDQQNATVDVQVAFQ
jgi:outer membrane protein assembly factor BamA